MVSICRPRAAILCGSSLDAHGRLLLPADADLTDPVDLRDLLGEDVVCAVVDDLDRQCVGAERQDHDRRVGRIDLAEVGADGRSGRQLAARRVDSRLNVLRRGVDVPRQFELQGDARRSERAHRGHLGDTRDGGELPLKRRGDVGGHRVRAGPWQAGADLQGWKIHVWKGRNGQLEVGDDAQNQEGYRDERCRHRPPNERARKTQEAGPATGAGGLTLTRAPALRVIWPSTTTDSPGWTPEVITATEPCVTPTFRGRTMALPPGPTT